MSYQADTGHKNSHQNKWPQKLITASLAVSRQILHSKLAFAFGCSLFDAPEADDGSFVEGISPPEVAMIGSAAMLIHVALSETSRRTGN